MTHIRKDNFKLAGSPIIDGNIKEYLFFKVDDSISFAISLLNKKGYFTTMACSGHPFNKSGLWVSFKEHYNFNIDLPENFEFFYKDNVLFISYKFTSQINSIDILREIANINIIFYQWAKQLRNKGCQYNG